MTVADLRGEAQRDGTDEVLVLVGGMAPENARGDPCRTPPDP